MNPTKIVIFSRPWEVSFHLALARELQARFAAPVTFVTAFESARRQAVRAGFTTIYLPHALASVETQPESRMREIDAEIRKDSQYGIGVMAASERFLPSRKVRDEFVNRHVALLDGIIGHYTLSISSMYDHFVYWLAGALANARRGWHFAFVGCGMPPGRTIALRSPSKPWSVEIEESAAADIFRKARAALEVPPELRIDYMRPIIGGSKTLKWVKARINDFELKRIDYHSSSYFQSTGFIREWLTVFIKHRIAKIRASLHRRIFDIPDGASESDLRQLPAFFYAPLHMEPEASIFMYSPWLRSQLEFCRVVAQSLPPGARLVVKENPKMAGYRTREFYEELRAIPNVLLAAPGASSTALILQSKGVIVLAGTAALEARVLGRPAAALAAPPFGSTLNASDLLGHGGLATLPSLLNAWLHNNEETIPDAVWKKWVEGTFPGNLVPKIIDGQLQIELNANVFEAAKYIDRVLRAENGSGHASAAEYNRIRSGLIRP